jgi:alcohol dehydrogenase YqhD (iron-dependent ADH family)
MEAFTYSYPVKVYFGEKTAQNNLPAELTKVGKNVMLAYGGGSVIGCCKKFTKEELYEVLKESL